MCLACVFLGDGEESKDVLLGQRNGCICVDATENLDTGVLDAGGRYGGEDGVSYVYPVSTNYSSEDRTV